MEDDFGAGRRTGHEDIFDFRLGKSVCPRLGTIWICRGLTQGRSFRTGKKARGHKAFQEAPEKRRRAAALQDAGARWQGPVVSLQVVDFPHLRVGNLENALVKEWRELMLP